MEINAALNLAFPIRWNEAGEPLVYAYHTPIGREVFEANYRAIAAANMTIFSKGVGFAAESGPLIAALALRDAARADALENGLPEGSGDALLADLKRLTLVLAPSAKGYEPVPVDIALARKVIDAEDWREAESSIAFFTCGLWMTRRERREQKRTALALVLRGSTTSLAPTAFAASLATSTPAATIEVPTPSLVPS